IERLPLIRTKRIDFTWCQKSVHTTEKNRRWVCVFRTVFNLNFVTSAKINSTIAAFLVPELHVQFEIGKLLIGNQISPRFFACEHTVYHFPLILTLRSPTT